LKERSRVKTIVQGYCNGHHMYFPTIEAAFEGGYGADDTVSWVPLGAGEEMMDRALINIYTMLAAK
jgi:neutral ceramidase